MSNNIFGTKARFANWLGITNCAAGIFYIIFCACAMSTSDMTTRWKEISDNGGALPYIGFVLSVIIVVISIALIIIACYLLCGHATSALRTAIKDTPAVLIAVWACFVVIEIIRLCTNSEYLFWGAFMIGLGFTNFIMLPRAISDST